MTKQDARQQAEEAENAYRALQQHRFRCALGGLVCDECREVDSARQAMCAVWGRYVDARNGHATPLDEALAA